MNKSKFPMPIRLRKKMNKEIRSAMPSFESPASSHDIKPEGLLSRLPPKLRKKESSALKIFEKKMALQKKKRGAKHSRRTTPGLVDSESSPSNAHAEGKRWIKTLQNQATSQTKIFNRKMGKKK